jgi:two-component system response regulator AdeR
MEGGGEQTVVEEDAKGEQTATILLVDDESIVLESFRLYLETTDYELHTAANGTEALEVIDEDIDIVLLDRRMPDLSGDEVLEEIREQNFDCRVALVTAVDPDFDILQIDCDDYLVKPVDADDLLETVERLEMLDEYSEAQQELSSLRVKRNVLEVEKHQEELDDNDEFRELTARIEELEDQIEDLEAEFDGQVGYGE